MLVRARTAVCDTPVCMEGGRRWVEEGGGRRRGWRGEGDGEEVGRGGMVVVVVVWCGGGWGVGRGGGCVWEEGGEVW